jgi:hypothetical protein
MVIAESEMIAIQDLTKAYEASLPEDQQVESDFEDLNHVPTMEVTVNIKIYLI